MCALNFGFSSSGCYGSTAIHLTERRRRLGWCSSRRRCCLKGGRWRRNRREGALKPGIGDETHRCGPTLSVCILLVRLQLHLTATPGASPALYAFSEEQTRPLPAQPAC